MTLALTIAVLAGGGVMLILRRGMMRIVVGFMLLSHAANLLLFASGGASRREPPIGAGLDPAVTADPLPQAFVLTAIVISFAITIYMLVLAVVGDEDDDTEMPVAGRESEVPDLREEDDLYASEFDDDGYLDPTDDADYRRRLQSGHGRLAGRRGWTDEDW